MVCESWKTKFDAYLDGELSEAETRAFDTHVRSCPMCAADALSRVQTKRAVQAAGRRFTPSAEFRRRIQQSIAPRAQRTFRPGWLFAAAVAAILVAAALSLSYVGSRSRSEHVFSEIADLHVETLASSSPVDVVSTDRHTVKPWFQGRIPFAFNLPELQNTEFSLLGGRVTYLDQTPGAHLIYDLHKHHISVFIFPEAALRTRLGENLASPQRLPFNMETWARSGLRYFVIGDASAPDIESLAKLFRTN